jgi:hypothetical protein
MAGTINDRCASPKPAFAFPGLPGSVPLIMESHARPPVTRLDPKLTKRGAFPQPSYETLASSRSGFSQSSFGTQYTEESASSDGPVIENTNPRIHLLHNGKWIPKKVSQCTFR